MPKAQLHILEEVIDVLRRREQFRLDQARAAAAGDASFRITVVRDATPPLLRALYREDI